MSRYWLRQFDGPSPGRRVRLVDEQAGLDPVGILLRLRADAGEWASKKIFLAVISWVEQSWAVWVSRKVNCFQNYSFRRSRDVLTRAITEFETIFCGQAHRQHAVRDVTWFIHETWTCDGEKNEIEAESFGAEFFSADKIFERKQARTTLKRWQMSSRMPPLRNVRSLFRALVIVRCNHSSWHDSDSNCDANCELSLENLPTMQIRCKSRCESVEY